MTRLKRRFDRFLAMLDSEAVGLYKIVLYTIMIFTGLYNIIFARNMVSVVEGALPPWAYLVMLYLFTVGPAICLAGKLIDPHSQWGKTAFHMMFLGDFMAWGAFTVYLAATVYTSHWGDANLAGGLTLFFWCGSLMLWIRALRRLHQPELWGPV